MRNQNIFTFILQQNMNNNQAREYVSTRFPQLSTTQRGSLRGELETFLTLRDSVHELIWDDEVQNLRTKDDSMILDCKPVGEPYLFQNILHVYLEAQRRDVNGFCQSHMSRSAYRAAQFYRVYK